MSPAGPTWELWAHRYESGKFWNIGNLGWVKLHQLPDPIAPVLVEEVLGDLYGPEVTHYGGRGAEGSRYRHNDIPTMIQVRTGSDHAKPKRALRALSMCLPYGLDIEIKDGKGSLVRTMQDRRLILQRVVNCETSHERSPDR